MFRSKYISIASLYLDVSNRLSRPSHLVTNAKGAQIQKKFWEELMVKLEKVSPGIESGI